MAENEKVLDLSEKNLKKLEKRDGVGFHSLILDNNELCKLENLDRFPDLEKLSACGNRLSRMYGVAKLHHLVHLDLSNNNIAWIEDSENFVIFTLKHNDNSVQELF
ncbi:protein phosphatase 1 regulatory subunit 7-like [Centruroides sculpturatus]|uniref:protein phosphatase 1 regulatory subunit 7-like n=1 Tax=Centruroides sculpturatus TaxID=218467 RepID=UPI000C6D6AA9|nr:protein phosphatase 1 regulatory subunit 7-like [Centruroides sculpturatus]